MAEGDIVFADETVGGLNLMGILVRSIGVKKGSEILAEMKPDKYYFNVVTYEHHEDYCYLGSIIIKDGLWRDCRFYWLK